MTKQAYVWDLKFQGSDTMRVRFPLPALPLSGILLGVIPKTGVSIFQSRVRDVQERRRAE